jgi:hypothetical protein
MELQVFWDSKLSIHRMARKYFIENIDLQVLGQRLKLIYATFSSISFQHIFHEMNLAANRLSKEALDLLEFPFILKEFLDGEAISIRGSCSSLDSEIFVFLY